MAVGRARSPRVSGQHFLRSPRLAEALVREADVRPDELVVEIGAGEGRLTSPLAETGARIHAVELDPLLGPRLRERFAAHPNVEVLQADALATPLPSEAFRLIGNLPFQHTTAILRRVLDCGSLARADVIVQWDVARKRASPWPSTLLNVYWSAWYELHVVRRLPAACFEPAPRVDAGVLRIVRRATPLVPPADAGRYHRFLSGAFARRGLAVDRRLKRVARDLGVTPSSRPHELDTHQWAALFRAVRPGR